MPTQSTKRPRQGQTIAMQGDTQERAPQLPNERDTSAASQPAAQDAGKKIGKIAHGDLAKGLKDTSKQPEMDAAYKKTKEPKSA